MVMITLIVNTVILTMIFGAFWHNQPAGRYNHESRQRTWSHSLRRTFRRPPAPKTAQQSHFLLMLKTKV